MSHVRRFDHVGITVADHLDAVAEFFVTLGLEIEGRTFVEGEFLDTVIGIPGSKAEILMLRPPDNGTRIELSTFVRPDAIPGSPGAMSNELGLRNVAFEVHDLQAAVDQAASAGRVGGRDRRVRGFVADGLRPRSRGNHRLSGAAHRLTRSSRLEHGCGPSPSGHWFGQF